MKMTRDEIEFLISQYLDGTTNELDRARIEEVLATDSDARGLFAEYHRLNEVVKSAMPMPDIAWDQFAASISSETAKLDAPVKHYRLSFATWSKVAALAAMVTIVVGVIVKSRPASAPNDRRTSVAVVRPMALNLNPVAVEINTPPALAQAPVSEIRIGQPAGFASADYHAADAIVSSPTSIRWIAAGEGSAQDTEPTLY